MEHTPEEHTHIKRDLQCTAATLAQLQGINMKYQYGKIHKIIKFKKHIWVQKQKTEGTNIYICTCTCLHQKGN